MKISLITTTFNSAKTIRSTFDSVLCQTHQDIEYLIIDGCSTDNTLDIIKEYEPLFKGRMRWISESDDGLYDAFNKGINMATGDVIGILNGDDFFTSDDILETIATHIGSVDAVYGDVHFVHSNNQNKCVRYYSSRRFRPWKMKFGYMPAHPSFYAHREIYEKYGLYSLDYQIASDYDMMVRLFCKYKIKTRYIQKDFVTMRTGGMSTSSVKNRLVLTIEDAKACKRYGIYSNFLMCSVKYLTKIFEFF